ncbi:amidohydrolase family protein [Ostertagia ostertagi]
MKHICLTILFVITCFAGFSQHDTVFYSVVNKGKITGGGKDWKEGDAYHSTYQFNDRGRGDSTHTVFYTSQDGRVAALKTTGVDYYKNPYEEKFDVLADSAVWTVNGDRKSAKYNHQIYPADYGLLVKWTLKQPGKKTEILPEGTMRMEAPVDKTITVKGKTIRLKLITRYTEPSPTPSFVWMTDSLDFFATVSGWQSFIQKGYEDFTDTLFTLQEKAAQGYYTNELKNNSAVLATHVVLTHAAIFQSATASIKKDMTVEIVNGRIQAIYPSAQKNPPQADTIINCRGKFLMPGLWDMHAHYSKTSGSGYLAGGVTHLRDMGNDQILLTYKDQIANNALLGPDISYLSGFIDREDPFQGPTGKIIRSLDEGFAAIDEFKRLGYQQIKLYSAIKPAWVKPMAAYAHKAGLKVCGHIPAFMTAEQAIKDGYDELTHMNFIFLNFMGDTIDTRTPARFRAVGANGGQLDLNSKAVNDFISLMKEKKIALDATLNVWQGMFDEFKGDTMQYLKPVVSWLPKQWLSSLAIQTPYGTKADKHAYKAAFSNMKKMLKKLYDNGILLVPGTDGGEANALHHELEIYVQAGIPANQVLKIATYNAALNCNLQNLYGSIAPGREADIILIDGNPVANISEIRRVKWVIKNKRMYAPRQLLAARGWNYY